MGWLFAMTNLTETIPKKKKKINHNASNQTMPTLSDRRIHHRGWWTSIRYQYLLVQISGHHTAYAIFFYLTAPFCRIFPPWVIRSFFLSLSLISDLLQYDATECSHMHRSTDLQQSKDSCHYLWNSDGFWITWSIFCKYHPSQCIKTRIVNGGNFDWWSIFDHLHIYRSE